MLNPLIKLLTLFLACLLISAPSNVFAVDPIAELATTGLPSPEPQIQSIAVVGDYVANWTGQYLTNYYHDRTNLTIDNLAHSTAGLIEKNALAAQTAVIIHKKPSTIIICLGSNDVQQINGIAPSDLAFINIYKQQARFFAEQMKNSGAQIFWLSAPPFGMVKHDETVQKYNDIYKQLCLEYGFDFIDIWPDFSAMENADSLRSTDHIGFTPAGLEILTKTLRAKIDSPSPYHAQYSATGHNAHIGPADLLDITGNTGNLAGADITHLFTPIPTNYSQIPSPQDRADNFSQY